MIRISADMNPLIHGSRAVKRCTACMVEQLIKNSNFEFRLIYFDYKFSSEKYLRPLNTHIDEKVIPVPYRLLIPAWQRFSWPTIETISPSCDIFYTNELFFPPAKRAVVLATIHGLAYKIIPDKLPYQDVQSLERGLSFLLKHADYLVAVSKNTKQELINQLGIDPKRIYVVTHGIDDRFKQRENQQKVLNNVKSNFGLESPYILYVGAIGIHKNVMGILNAYDILSRETSHHLVLAGPPDSAWGSANQFVVEKNLKDKVHFLGHVDDTERLVDLYNGADLFIFPSFYEGWTSPPLEAMACGTPVITSNCSSLPETVGDAAIKIDPENINELSQTIIEVLGDRSLRDDLIRKGRAHAAVHKWEKAADNLKAVFEEIQARGPWNKKKE